MQGIVHDLDNRKKGIIVMYQNYQAMANANDSFRYMAQTVNHFVTEVFKDIESPAMNKFHAIQEQIDLMGLTHKRPAFELDPVTDASGQSFEVREELVHQTAFCHLVKFKKDTAAHLPKVLLVAPMSGHFATLLRGTLQVLVQDHEVYITDWLNIRDIPISKGEFDFDAYTDEIITGLKFLGPQTHLMGICQPTVACLVATSILAQDADDCVPISLTLMAGPIDTRINPTAVNDLAKSKPFEWFEKNLINVVPGQFAGAGRRVYPGFIQLSAFMNMNLERHQQSFKDLYKFRVDGMHEKADQIREFYKEYFAIMDLSGPFYLETIDKVFQTHQLPRGKLTYKGKLVKPQAIKKTFLTTIEGDRDDICGVGQTLAAHDLCSCIPMYMKTHHLQAGVGHYGVFSGRKWAGQIYPVIRSIIQSTHF
jgi:polyhydroxyalkanoate depolymerase